MAQGREREIGGERERERGEERKRKQNKQSEKRKTENYKELGCAVRRNPVPKK